VHRRPAWDLILLGDGLNWLAAIGLAGAPVWRSLTGGLLGRRPVVMSARTFAMVMGVVLLAIGVPGSVRPLLH
jgi:hypothetical protein